MVLDWLRTPLPGDPVTFTVEEERGSYQLTPAVSDASVADTTVETEVVALDTPSDSSTGEWCINIDLTYEDDQRRRTTYLSRTAPIRGARPNPTIEVDEAENVIRVVWGS